MNNFSTDQEKTFNAGLLSVERLHNLLEDCNKYARLCTFNDRTDIEVMRNSGMNQEALKFWYQSIKAFRREIRPKLVKKEIIKINKKFAIMRTIGALKKTIKTADGTYSIIDPRKFNQYMKLFDTLEMMLRCYADRHGLLIPNAPFYDNVDIWRMQQGLPPEKKPTGDAGDFDD